MGSSRPRHCRRASQLDIIFRTYLTRFTVASAVVLAFHLDLIDLSSLSRSFPPVSVEAFGGSRQQASHRRQPSCLYAVRPKLKAKKGKIKKKKSKPLQQSSETSTLIQTLQAECHTPSLILYNVGSKLTPNIDIDGKVSSLVLVRLAKLAVERTNAALYGDGVDVKQSECVQLWDEDGNPAEAINILTGVCSTLANAIETSAVDLDCGVDGIKAAGVISRLLHPTHDTSTIANVFEPLVLSCSNVPIDDMGVHHLSGLRWAYDNLALCHEGTDLLPTHIDEAYRQANLPFRIRPGLLKDIDGLTVFALSSQVEFVREVVRTTATSKTVAERRLTAWEGESIDTVPGFEYSGKVMKTSTFSPLVRSVRDVLQEKMDVNYDCCLLNLYPDGESGMRYHIDPDQGKLWDYVTAVVSVGAARRFAFRRIPGLANGAGRPESVHNFVVISGDVTEMFADCQERYQHAVKTAEGREKKAARSSLVYKKTLPNNG